MNWFVIVFNNLYNKLQDLFAPIKSRMSRDNKKFNLRLCPSCRLFVILNLKEEDERCYQNDTKTLGYLGSNRVSEVHSQCAPIDFNEEMEDVEEIGGMNIQLETSRQLEILPTLLPTLRSWNLGQLCP